jgi:hypothetical protein
MTAVGVPWDRSIVANLENGRRKTVSVVELLALAYVLEVLPVHLLVPVEPDARYRPVPTRNDPADEVRDWLLARGKLAGMDVRVMFNDAPASEVELLTDALRKAEVIVPRSKVIEES